jgi:HK97 family phage major capsid protein
MLKSIQLKEQRASLAQQARLILTESTERKEENLSAEHRGKFDEIMAQADKLQVQIEQEERNEKLEKVEESTRVKQDESRLVTRPQLNENSERKAFNSWVQRSSGFGSNVKDSDIEVCFNPYAREHRFELPDFDTAEKRVGLGTQTGSVGAYLIPTLVPQAILHFMRYYCPLMQNVRVERTENGDPINWPSYDATGMVAGIVAEQGTPTEQDPVFGKVPLNAFTFRNFVAIDNELIQDSVVDLVPLVSNMIGEACGRGIDLACVTGTSSTGGTVTNSILGAAAAGGVVQTGSAISTLSFDPLISMKTTVDKVYADNGAYFMNYATVGSLRLVKDTTGRYIWADYLNPVLAGEQEAIRGHKVIVSNNISAFGASGHNTFVVFTDPKLFLIRMVKDIVITINPYLLEKTNQIAIFYKFRLDSNFVGPTQSITYLST